MWPSSTVESRNLLLNRLRPTPETVRRVELQDPRRRSSRQLLALLALFAQTNALAQHALGCPARIKSPAVHVVGRDAQGLRHVELPQPPSRLSVNAAFVVWIPHPAFKPFPSAAAVYPSTRVETKVGAVDHCIPHDAVLANASSSFGVMQITFDPKLRTPSQYPFHPAIELAGREGLLSTRQRALTEAAQRELERDAEALTRALADFASSPRSPAAQARFRDALTEAGRLTSLDAAELEVARLLDRSQRTFARGRGVEIEGRFSLVETPTHLELAVQACSWAQLAHDWNARVAQLSSIRAPLVHARAELVHEEAPDLNLKLAITERETGYRMLGHALASLAGLSLTE